MGIIPFKKKKPHKTRDGKIGLTLKAHNIDTIIDIGANNGQTRDSLRLHGFTGDIYSIEPVPSLQDVLKAKAQKDSSWHILPPLAIGDKNGECKLNISAASDMSSVLPASGALMQALPDTKVMETVTVPMKTLDTVYAELNLANKNTFIKIDAQGYEMNILRHAPETLQNAKGFQIEMSLFPLYEGEILFDEIIAFMKKTGFTPHMLVETNFSRRLNRQLQVDGIFFKNNA